ncbi:Nn.00g035570.m01.CDS01 [Neocucurbitaria sp. VM-36]
MSQSTEFRTRPENFLSRPSSLANLTSVAVHSQAQSAFRHGPLSSLPGPGRSRFARWPLPVIHHDTYLLVHTMTADLHTPESPVHEPACYFSILPSSTAHFSVETPSLPTLEYSPYTAADPINPLLAFRPAPPLHMSSPSDASRLLQLQTSAAHRPSPEPLQQRASSTSSSSSNSSMSSQSLFCCRCRRDCLTGMYQIGTNRYYCSHCAKMTGYSAG